jgi:hypothetical protein
LNTKNIRFFKGYYDGKECEITQFYDVGRGHSYRQDSIRSGYLSDAEFRTGNGAEYRSSSSYTQMSRSVDGVHQQVYTVQLSITFKGTVSRDFMLLVFFMNQFPPQPQSITLGPFRILSTIRGDILTGINDTGAKIFFHLPPVSPTSVVHLELRISPRVFEKIRNGPNGILRGLETDS